MPDLHSAAASHYRFPRGRLGPPGKPKGVRKLPLGPRGGVALWVDFHRGGAGDARRHGVTPA